MAMRGGSLPASGRAAKGPTDPHRALAFVSSQFFEPGDQPDEMWAVDFQRRQR